MIASFVAWRRRRKIRRLGRAVAKLKLRKAKDTAYLAYWSMCFRAGARDQKSMSQANLEADLTARIAAASFKLSQLEPELLELERQELKIGLWAAEKEQARTLACFVLNADPAPRYQAIAEAVLKWAGPTEAERKEVAK